MSFPNSPHVVVDVDDDDAFDWEAAVREIDVACKGTSSTKATAATFGSDSTLSRPNPKKPRQSTLDRFVKPMNHSKQVVADAYENDNERGDANARCYCQVDLEAAKTWIYPVNIPLRDYQLSITKTALFTNTLVALPTGLGKTFIAAVVMYNYFRWFPEGKIVFTAPSRPLVLQQIEACHNIVGIPQEWAIDLTGQTSPSKRACLWEAKRVFFVTPQVLEKDIQSGTFSKKHLVCLVIDEAHRALGNYSYCVAVRELMAVQLQFRILALTATPGSKQQTIQKVIDNLQISKLEYRNDTDHDVIPYVHNRKLELIKVAMGKDAIEISDKLLEAIRPFVAKLSSFGVPLNRDVQMLSPCDLLNTRDKFRQAPPQDLSHVKYGEVEGCFGALITLYHIRKLLSSHGIKPAYEMLEEKLQQGSFARLMTRNEVIWKTKLLMQQSLSHGAPNPKLLKMTEILVDHFKQNDPKNSRVIIFSNFRGSVRDIMSTLSSIGESVKATEFIGQSSGKNLKGQTQKIQQAVLQKFRTGGYNIIVATSIGEEGLDIMEVDLVICFDANISPLRMIQRMGRTGRKHDGRVVVLACEGSEIKGYMRKQANSKAVSKHMRNGGINSFDFHSSPRMIPHICKPDVHFVKFSIEQFVPRGKKVKDDLINDHSFKDKLSNDEADLIAKYFPSSRENTWKSSLIAFPHFQSFPSSVYHVMHSFRTRMLIGTMQHLQAQSFPVDSKAVPLKVRDNFSSNECVEANNLTRDTKDEMGSLHDIPGQHPEKKATEAEAWGTVISSCTEKCDMSDSSNRNLTMHCFLFEAVYVSVKPSGAVSISSVPSLPFVKEAPLCKSKAENNTEQLNTVKHNYSTSVTSAGDNCELKHNLTNPAESNGAYDHFMSNSLLSNSNAHEKPVLDEVENIPSTPSPKKNYMDSEVVIVDTPVSTVRNVPVLLANKPTDDIKDVEMSPRLTNMIEEGVVPESPLGEMVDHSLNENTVHSVSSLEHVNGGLFANCSRKVHGNKISKDSALQSDGLPMCELRRQLLFPLNVPFGFHNSPSLINLSSKKSESGKECKNAGALGDVCDSPINIDIHTPLIKMHSCSNAREGVCGSPNNGETRTPLVNLTNSCSNDWHLSSGSKSIQQSPKFRRLRKYRDSSNTIKKDLTAPMSNEIKSTTRTNPEKRIKSKRKMVSEAKLFIDEEAEVSSDAQVSSDDEEEDDDKDSNDGSFIDDRINPTMENTQAEAIRSDMMAIYRRSLLSQSPMESPLCRSTNLHPNGIQCTTVTDETGSCSSGKICHSLQTPQTGIQSAVRSSNLCVMDSVGNPQINMASESSVAPKEEKKIENRKRKLSFHQFGYDPETSLQPQRLFHSESTANTSLQCQPENIKHNEDVFYDDQFYEGLDLDALEAQATILLKNKSELLIDRRQSVVPELSHSPSFDLGI